MFYRLKRQVKHSIIDYLQRIFFLNARGDLIFTDGEEKISFPTQPTVIETSNWDGVAAPAVLIGVSTGGLEEMSISSNFIGVFPSQDLTIPPVPTGPTDQFQAVIGGIAQLTVSLSCVARTKESRENLTDIVGLYLTRPDAKQWFQANGGIYLPEPPQFVGETERDTGTSDFLIYEADLSLKLKVQWEERDRTYEPLTTLLVEEPKLEFVP